MKDINGVDLKVGDYCLYSEMPFSNYADSLVVIIKHDGVIKIQSIVHNKNCGGRVEYGELLEPIENCTDIKYCTTEKDLEKIEYNQQGQTPIDFMQTNYPNGVRIK